MRRLLVIEDFPPLAKGLLRALRREGYDVQMAASRAEARHVDGFYDVAVIDLELPDGYGTEVARDLLANGRVEHCVFFTACRDSALLESAAALGAVVDKAAGLDLLLATLKQRSGAEVALDVAVGDARSSTRVSRTQSQRSGARRIRR